MLHPVWCTDLPEHWASSPSLMSYSTLRALEACPLSWSLARSGYPRVWDRDGYPPRARAATLAGQIIHTTLERITVAFASESGREVEPAARLTHVLMKFGGLSKLLINGIEEVRATLHQNPRLQQRADEVSEELHRQLPALRARTQRFLSQVELTTDGVLTIGRGGASPKDSSGNRARNLGNGSHPEVSLRHPSANWYGKADLIRLSDEECEIVDFKTGQPKDEHALQLALNAWLWYRDKSVNPQGRLATRLRVVYSTASIAVPAPGASEFDEMEVEMVERGFRARAEVANVPPTPRPSREVCTLCDVRQLCPTYWQADTQRMLFDAAPEESRDIEVQILSRQGEWSWRARVLASGRMATGEKIILRAPPREDRFTEVLQSAKQARLVGIQFQEATPDNAGVASVLLSRSSEVFRVS